MNRAERRKMMKTIPGYKKALKSATEKAVDDLETMFRRNWEEDDLSPKAGDVLMFYIKTDEYGTPMMDLEAVRQTAEMIGNILEDKGVAGLFLMDKICLFSIDSADTAIKRLENCISYIREAADQVPDIENGNLGDPVTIEMEEAQDPFKRVL